MSKSLRHDLSVQMVKVSDLVPWSRNPRHNDPAADRLAYTIQEHGWTTPILVQKESGRIIGGHTRLKAAIKIGLDEVPVIHLDVEDRQADAIAIADNRLGEIAEWDGAELAKLLEEIEADGGDLLAIGYNDADWSELIDSLEDDEAFDDLPGDVDPEEPPEDPVSKLGEVYELGPHRLVCGDSTDNEAWSALMRGDKAKCVWTDPPYGVAVNQVQGVEEARRLNRRTDGKVVKNDAMTPEETADLWRRAFAAMQDNSEPGAAWYASAPPGPIFWRLGQVLEGFNWRRTLVWVKDRFAFGRGDYHYRHEPIFHGWFEGSARLCPVPRDVDTVQEHPRPGVSKEHPTMKPPGLIAPMIENSSKRGWLVADPFGGSGSTLIACARSGRVARLVELDPGYCDVIRRRWTKWAREAGKDPGPGALD